MDLLNEIGSIERGTRMKLSSLIEWYNQIEDVWGEKNYNDYFSSIIIEHGERRESAMKNSLAEKNK